MQGHQIKHIKGPHKTSHDQGRPMVPEGRDMTRHAFDQGHPTEDAHDRPEGHKDVAQGLGRRLPVSKPVGDGTGDPSPGRGREKGVQEAINIDVPGERIGEGHGRALEGSVKKYKKMGSTASERGHLSRHDA